MENWKERANRNSVQASHEVSNAQHHRSPSAPSVSLSLTHTQSGLVANS